MTEDTRPVGVILAGGLARRMGGGDKGLLRLWRRPILDHVIDRVRPQVRALALNANGDPGRFRRYGLPVLADPAPGHPGPLAGVLAGMRWARARHPGAPLLLSVPTDAPLLPPDLVARLAQGLTTSGATIAWATSNGQAHPVIALWPVSLADALAQALAEGVHSVAEFGARHGVAAVEFAAEGADPFLNINTRADLARAARLAG
jgi:molybdopterin-guanine dinucleotide biosynthesis protein A